MGLDGVELVMAMEEEFGIIIEDEEAQSIVTPNDAIQLISTKVNISNNNVCLSQRHFHKLRKFLEKELALKRSMVKLNVNLNDLVCRDKEKEVWLKISNEFNIIMPELTRPNWIENLIWVSSLILGFFSILFHSVLLGLIIFITSSSLGFWLTKSLKKQIPKLFSKIENIVGYMVSQDKNDSCDTDWSKEQIKAKVKYLVVEQLGCEEYNENWEFVKDFGID